MTASLNYLNYLNLIGYILNCFFVFGAEDIFGYPSNAELSDKYPTILTPGGWAFAIWAIIFTAEGIFAVTQMVPKYRDHPMVQDGVKFWYFVSCLVQSGWTLAFGYEVIILSLIFMVSILLSLFMILVNQNNLESDDRTVGEYWLFRFGFAVHCGWIISATCLNVGVVAVNELASVEAQTNLAIVCLVFIVLCSFAATFLPKHPIFAIPGVACWTTLAITFELNDPSEKIAAFFSEKTINGFKITTAVLCGFLFLWIVVFATYQLVTRSCGFQKPKTNDEKDEETSNQGVEPELFNAD